MAEPIANAFGNSDQAFPHTRMHAPAFKHIRLAGPQVGYDRPYDRGNANAVAKELARIKRTFRSSIRLPT